jgi:hypothetical protein
MNPVNEERQVKAWEEIAEALATIAKAQTDRANIEQARLEMEKTIAAYPK